MLLTGNGRETVKVALGRDSRKKVKVPDPRKSYPHPMEGDQEETRHRVLACVPSEYR